MRKVEELIESSIESLNLECLPELVLKEFAANLSDIHAVNRKS